MTLHFQVNENKIVCKNPELLPSKDTIDYIKCSFDFKSSALTDYDGIVAVFKSASFNLKDEVLLDSSYSCFMPVEIYKRGGVIQLLLYGDTHDKLNKHITSTYIGPVEIFFGHNVILPLEVPSKYDVFVAEFTNIKQGLDSSITTLDSLISNFRDIEDIYLNEDGTLTVLLSNGDVYTSKQSLIGPPGPPGPAGTVVEPLSNADIESLLS